MNQRDHQQQSQCDEYGNLTIGLDTADNVLTGLADRVSAACQAEVVGNGCTSHHTEHSNSRVAVAGTGQDQLTQGAAAQQHGTPANNDHAQEVPQVCAVGNRLALEAQLEGAGCQVANQGNGDSAVTVFGLMTGAAISHNFGLAGSADSVNEAGEYIVGGIKTNGQIAVCIALAVLLVISLMHLPKKAK